MPLLHVQANPFGASGGAASHQAMASAEWGITMAQQAKYNNIFKTCNPVNGLVSGEAAKTVLEKSRLPYDALGMAVPWCLYMYVCLYKFLLLGKEEEHLAQLVL